MNRETTLLLVLIAIILFLVYGCDDPPEEALVTDVAAAQVSTTLPPPPPATTTTTTVRPTTPAPRPKEPVSRGVPRTSGPALLERIAQCESGGNYTAQNKRSTASGKYQYLDTTWNNYKGYAKARYAPPAIQDERARADFARLGTRPWEASRACWGR